MLAWFHFSTVRKLNNKQACFLSAGQKRRESDSNMVMEEFSTDMEGATTEQLCCLMDDKKPCMLTAGNASYGKKIQKTVQQRKLKLELNEKVGCVGLENLLNLPSSFYNLRAARR